MFNYYFAMYGNTQCQPWCLLFYYYYFSNKGSSKSLWKKAQNCVTRLGETEVQLENFSIAYQVRDRIPLMNAVIGLNPVWDRIPLMNALCSAAQSWMETFGGFRHHWLLVWYRSRQNSFYNCLELHCTVSLPSLPFHNTVERVDCYAVRMLDISHSYAVRMLDISHSVRDIKHAHRVAVNWKKCKTPGHVNISLFLDSLPFPSPPPPPHTHTHPTPSSFVSLCFTTTCSSFVHTNDTTSSFVHFLPFCGRRYKMTHKVWCVQQEFKRRNKCFLAVIMSLFVWSVLFRVLSCGKLILFALYW